MIIDYDHNPSLNQDQKMQSLVESIILAFGEIQTMLSQQQKQMDIIVKAIGTVSDDISGIRNDITAMQDSITTMQGNISTLQSNVSTIQGNITTIQGNITTINGQITALEAVAADAILQSTAS